MIGWGRLFWRGWQRISHHHCSRQWAARSRHGAWQEGGAPWRVCSLWSSKLSPSCESATSRLYLILLCNKSIWVSCQEQAPPCRAMCLFPTAGWRTAWTARISAYWRCHRQRHNSVREMECLSTARSHPSPCSLMMVSLPPVSSVHIRSFQYFCKGPVQILNE